MPFFQSPPTLPSGYTTDRVLRGYLARTMPRDAISAIEPQLTRCGELASGPIYEMLLGDLQAEPKLTQWDAWGRRVDHVEVTPLWKEMQKIAAEEGLVATAYERKSGAFSRAHQFALVYLLSAPSGVYSCPLAMTDGAAKTLTTTGNRALIDRAVTRLTSRDPRVAWTSGQWMTERTGGSDVAISETIAKPDHDGTSAPEAWRGQHQGASYRLFGTKWFTSAVTSQMSLTLARPQVDPPNAPGGSGLALFYVEMRNEDGTLNGIAVNRLKDKLGTRMVPTAELTLDGARAIAVAGTTNGIKNITPMLAITRTWNAVCAVSGMRHGIALARDFANRRVAFGSPLREKTLHLDTLAGMQAEFEAAFHLTFRAVELLGREEAREITDEESQLLRLMTPIVKLTTGKQAVALASETLEAFGGAGYVEDTGLPRILRDAQVLPIWEGTTNVLALDLLRALSRVGSLGPIAREVKARTEKHDARLAGPAEAARLAIAHAEAWLVESMTRGLDATEAGARRFALTLGRAWELALLVDHATWALAQGDARPLAAARRFARNGVDLITHETTGDTDTLAESRALANDEPFV